MDAKQYIKGMLENYLQQEKSIDTKRPFRCLNPAHKDEKPSMSIDRTSPSGLHCKCFSCGAYYDTIDLIGMDFGLSYTDAVNKAYEMYGKGYQNQAKNTQIRLHNTCYTIDDIQDEVKIDFTDIIKTAHKELLETPEALQHYQDRGLSMDIIRAYELGYHEKGYNHFLKAYPDHRSGSLKEVFYSYILPYPDTDGRYTYFLAEIEDRNKIDDYNGKYKKISKGESGISAQIFNERYIQNPPSVIFICEGVYDALSVEDAGGKAIAFVGTAHRRFLSLCKKYMPDTTFIISLDNDSSGQGATDKVKEGLDYLKIPYIVRTAENGKDFNEAIQTDRGAFTEYIQQAVADAEQAKNAEIQAYLQTSTAYHIQSFRDEIEKSKTATFLPTGFPSLDNLLDGGLYAGLYVVGAISSLGKTTLCLQLLDNIAAAGNDVIVFSLEMARSELMAKSISRHTLLADIAKYETKLHAKTVRGITTGTRYKDYSNIDREIIETAIEDYSKYAHHVYIHEGIGNIGVEQVREAVERHVKITGNKPVILIDYLQILAPSNERGTDKQNTDKNVLELKRLSRDYSIPVIGISSFNRDNYTQPVNMAAFKESGAVEYSSDVLIALQYEGMDYKDGEKDGDRQKRIRGLFEEQVLKGKRGEALSVQVKILKNRNGSKGDTALNFYPMFNLFSEKGKDGIAGVIGGDTGWIRV